MERMHPQDLRAIIAALQGIEAAVRNRGIPSNEQLVFLTDGLLAEVERTAKPEPATEPNSGWIARLTEARRESRAEGAREERERIIALLKTEVPRYDMSPFRLNSEWLRAALEPKHKEES